MTLTTIFRKFGTKKQLLDTVGDRDVDINHHFFLTNPSLDSLGVRVTFHSNHCAVRVEQKKPGRGKGVG